MSHLSQIKLYRKQQAEQLKKDTSKMTTLQTLDHAIQIEHINGILKGLDIATEILKGERHVI